MKGRGQLLAAVLVVAVAVAGGIALQRGVGTKAIAGPSSVAAPSGAWFCPHGGGSEWHAALEIANPGSEAVDVRVTTLSEDRPSDPTSYTVDAGAELLVPEETSSRAASSVVEYFGGWVGAAWVSHAGGDEGGVAAEPCSSRAGSTWLLPDASTQRAAEATSAKGRPPRQNAWVVVMNPFASDAVFSLTLSTDKDAPVHPGDWTNVVLKAHRSRAFYLNDQRLDFATVATTVEAKLGRVVAATLDINDLGGIRASLGQQPPTPRTAVLPGAFDQGRTELVVMNPTATHVQTAGTILGRRDPVPISGAAAGRVNPSSAETFPVTSDGSATLEVRVPDGIAVVRRTFGQTSDQAATGPGAPARAWVVLPAVAGSPSNPGIALANPSSTPVDVSLSYLPSENERTPAPITVRVDGLRTATVPADFVEADPSGAVLATSSDGTFLPAAASYSLGREGYAAYAVALGVPIPAEWVPSRP